MKKKSVLFLCTHNSARSQMAEGMLRGLLGSQYDAFSAGTEPGRANPYVAKAMAEIGFDISGHRSKHLNEFIDMDLDYVVTVCDNAKEACPFFLGGKTVIHHSFRDPSSFKGSDDEIVAGVRQVRDEIRDWILEQFGEKQV